jgi:hypothetical protein
LHRFVGATLSDAGTGPCNLNLEGSNLAIPEIEPPPQFGKSQTAKRRRTQGGAIGYLPHSLGCEDGRLNAPHNDIGITGMYELPLKRWHRFHTWILPPH